MTRINVSGSFIMFYFYKTQMLYHTFWLDHAFPPYLEHLCFQLFLLPTSLSRCVVTIFVWQSWGLLQSPLLPAALEDGFVTIFALFLWKALERVVVWRLYSQLHVLLNRFVRITSVKSDSQHMHHDLRCPRKEVLSQGKCRLCLSELPLPQGQNKERSEIWKTLWSGHRKCHSLYCWIHPGPRGLAAWAVQIFGSRKSSLEKEVFRSLIFGKFLPSLTKHTLGFTSFLNTPSIQGTLGVCGFRSSPRKRYLEGLRFPPPPPQDFLGVCGFLAY